MENIKYYQNIHFIGICGVSMKALAVLSKRLGANVSGSDRNYSSVLDLLIARGINAYCGANVATVEKAQLVVYSSAIQSDDEELSFARKNGIECVERKEFLAEASKMCDKTVAIAGSHGKTTTTALVCHILLLADAKFTGHIGGDFADKSFEDFCKGNDYFVTEACEYKQSFLCLSPYISVVLNCDFDHPDSYKNCQELQQSFENFCNKASSYCVIGESCKEKFAVEKGKAVVTFGYNFSCDYTAKNLLCTNGRYSFDLYKFGHFIDRVNLCVYGKFNIFNSLASIAICDILQVPMATILGAVNCFFGVERRFECKGILDCGARVIVDYAHHPEEIKQSIICARAIAKKRLFAVFEPHTYSRTKALYQEFLLAFAEADSIELLPTYSAREVEGQGLSSKQLYEGLQAKFYLVNYHDNYQSLANYLKNECESGDMILILGAGDVYKLADILK